MRYLRVLASVAFVLLSVGCASADPRRVDLLAMGDWGNGSANQKRVASAMSDYVSRQPAKPQAMLLAGDNFYVKMPLGSKDPKWKTLFEDMYDPKTLDFPFYASLGNHDYSDSGAAMQLQYAKENPASRWKARENWYRLDFPTDNPVVTVLMLDSNKSGKSSLSPAQWEEQKAWIAAELAKPRGTWTVLVAHHPLYSNGAHGDSAVLKDEWGPLMDKYKVDLYVAGHEHDLQHLELAGRFPSFVLCGGGGATTRPMARADRGPFTRATHGFVHMTFSPDAAEVRYVDATGDVVHRFTKDARTRQVRDQSPPSIEKAQPRKPASTKSAATTRRADD